MKSFAAPGYDGSYSSVWRHALNALSFEERVGLLVDREAAERDTKRLA